MARAAAKEHLSLTLGGKSVILPTVPTLTCADDHRSCSPEVGSVKRVVSCLAILTVSPVAVHGFVA